MHAEQATQPGGTAENCGNCVNLNDLVKNNIHQVRMLPDSVACIRHFLEGASCISLPQNDTFCSPLGFSASAAQMHLLGVSVHCNLNC